MEKVQSGQPLRIPAETFNAFLDAAQDFRNRQQARSRDPQPTFRQSGIVKVKNASGEDRGRFDILGIDRPIFTPTDNLDTFQNDILLVGVVPDKEDHPGRFCILLEPLAVDGIGLAVINGVSPVRLDVEEESDTFAEIEHEVTGFLKSGGSGSATILWKEPGTGADKWAVVRLGDAQPIIRKAEMIDTLKQGDTEPAQAWLLKYEDDAWARTYKQIDLYGDQGFRGVAFGKTATVDAGDKIDVYFSHEAKHWYGVVGGWYFHGDVVDDIPEGAGGEVKLNVGAGADAREITVPAYSPYAAVKKDDFVSANWNTFSLHWDIGPFQTGTAADPGCGLEKVDDANDPDDGKLRVKVADVAGNGLQAGTAGCELEVKPACGIIVDAGGVKLDAQTVAGPGLTPHGSCGLAVAPGCGIFVDGASVNVAPGQLAGAGLSTGGGCELQVNTGCGINLVNGAVSIDSADLVGNSRGLRTVGTCGIEINAGCGLKYNFDQIMIDADTLAGNGLELMNGTDCTLRAHLGCGMMFALDGSGAIEVNPFSIAGKGLEGDETDNSCLLDIKAGCGLFINGGNELEVAHDELAGAGLTIGNNCTLEVAAGCGLALDAGGEVRVERAALIGPGLKVGEGECDLAVDCDWIRDHCDPAIELIDGCGIYITQTGNDYTIEVAHDELAGKGLVLGSSCLLDVSVGCGLQFDGNQAIEVNPTALAGNGLVPGANCALDVDWGDIPVGCGIYWNGQSLEVASDELVGNGLTLGSNCTLDVDCSWISDNCSGSQGEQGYQGYQGSQGYQGYQGVDGPRGYQGFPGYQGPQGYQGYQGYQGERGYQGYQGFQGFDGPQGYQGFPGSQGPQGVSGSNGTGTQGPQGYQGSQGYQGAQGYQGGQGPQGLTGSQGSNGIGTPGPQGPQGSQGSPGSQGSGSSGPQGPQGVQGGQGPQGSQGSTGSQGFGTQGPQGPQGSQGSPGSQSSGSQGPQGPQGSTGMGTPGPQGPQGVPGTSGSQGGSQGPQGAPGPQGVPGSQGFGTQGPQGPPGSQGMGMQGPQGPQGAPGSSGSQGGSQGPQGAQGPQGVSGSQGFGTQGPQGPPGSQGMGMQGPQGPQGAPGSSGSQGGSQGPQGAQGPQGVPGSQGFGTQGPQGPPGSQGMGMQGPQGPQGAPGSSGSQGGSQGPQGAQGPQGVPGSQGFGTQGPQGPPGSQGMGMQGPQGPQGAVGSQGFGSQGPQGPQGSPGMPGMKMAIVPCEGEYVALFCVESPEVRFEDVVRVPITGPITVHPIDPRFIEVCAPGTIDVISVTSPLASLIGAAVDRDQLIVRIQGDLPPYVIVTLSGIRAGHRGFRFPRKTRDQMVRNNAFWSSAAS